VLFGLASQAGLLAIDALILLRHILLQHCGEVMVSDKQFQAQFQSSRQCFSGQNFFNRAFRQAFGELECSEQFY